MDMDKLMAIEEILGIGRTISKDVSDLLGKVRLTDKPRFLVHHSDGDMISFGIVWH